ncbi:MAG: anthranilate phosphoribosyltransferase [Bacteroidetes bacterium]|nr:MAG: anthranilate phosphoribosyltransferase [Bacteroidota bacterium]
MKTFVRKITERENLTREESAAAMRSIMEGQATEAQIAAFIIALKMKGETADELLGFVETMREKSIKVSLDDPQAIDMCGTGGDGSGTFNISTVASFVVAGTCVTVAKHGNRSISSSCGSADVLKALGVNIEITPQKVQECINSIGIGFLFAPLFHPAMKYAAKPRSELGVKTFFNMLGPLTNPAGVKRQLVGAFNHKAAALIGEVFEQLHPEKVCVVSSDDGLDELSLNSETEIWEAGKNNSIRCYKLSASAFKVASAHPSLLQGGAAEKNAEIAMDILSGNQGAHRNIVLINAAMGLYVAGKTSSPQDGIPIAAEAIDSGKAMQKLKSLITFTTSA